MYEKKMNLNFLSVIIVLRCLYVVTTMWRLYRGRACLPSSQMDNKENRGMQTKNDTRWRIVGIYFIIPLCWKFKMFQNKNFRGKKNQIKQKQKGRGTVGEGRGTVGEGRGTVGEVAQAEGVKRKSVLGTVYYFI